jgi:ABC-type branched-subunit amino acid transport system substrate-binding protein
MLYPIPTPNALKIGILSPVYTSSGYSAADNSALSGALLAISEINADASLLASVPIKFEWVESDGTSAALQGAYRLLYSAFYGAGADAVIGPVSTEAVRNSQFVVKGFDAPQIVYATASSEFDDSSDFPTL